MNHEGKQVGRANRTPQDPTAIQKFVVSNRKSFPEVPTMVVTLALIAFNRRFPVRSATSGQGADTVKRGGS